MIIISHVRRFWTSPAILSRSSIINKYLENRRAQKIEQVDRLKAELKAEASQESTDLECSQVDSGPSKYSTKYSQETLYNYYRTRAGRMLRTCVNAQIRAKKKAEFDVFYSAASLDAIKNQRSHHTRAEIDSFRSIDPRKPISGLMIFMWNIRGHEYRRRLRIWRTLSEEDRMQYRRTAMKVSPRIEQFSLDPGERDMSEKSFYDFIDRFWLEAEKLVEERCFLSNKHFLPKMRAKLCEFYVQVKKYGKLQVQEPKDGPPITAFDTFASRKGVTVVSPINTSESSDVRKRHSSLWSEWCALSSEDRTKYFNRPAKIPSFSLSSSKGTHNTIKEGLQAQHSDFIAKNYVKANQAVDAVYRRRTKDAEKDIMKPSHHHFKYTNVFRVTFWDDMKKELQKMFKSS